MQQEDRTLDLFCPSCHNIIDFYFVDKDLVRCSNCQYSIPFEKILRIENRTTMDLPDDAIQDILKVSITNEEDEKAKQAPTIVVECPNCGVDRLCTFTTAQLRSADEGSTIFYTCKTCGHKWNQNN